MGETVEELKDRLFMEFLDMLILRVLARGRPLGGYDIIALVRREFGVPVSAGTIRSMLHSMENAGTLQIALEGERKKVFYLTDKGKEFVKAVLGNRQEILDLVSKLL